MSNIVKVNFDRVPVKSPESNIPPEQLLPVIRKIKNLDAEDYARFVRLLCVWGCVDVRNLPGYGKGV